MTADNCISEPISSFGYPSQSQVQPSSQLLALQEAIDLLMTRIDVLEDENQALKSKLETLILDQSCFLRNQEILFRIINELRNTRDQSMSAMSQKRAEQIVKYMKEQPEHRASFESLKGYLGIDNVRLNEVIKYLMTLTPGRFGVQRAKGDKRKKYLILLPK
jgi:hypothetical protein